MLTKAHARDDRENNAARGGSIGGGELHGDGRSDALACQGSLVNDRGVRPLGRGDAVDFAAEAAGLQTALGVGFAQADKMGHDEGGFAWAVGDENVHSRAGSAGAWARRLEDDGVGGFVCHGDAGDFTNLEASSKQLNTRSPKGVSFEERNLQLALAEAEDHIGLLRNLHEHAGRRALAHDDVDRKLAVNAVSDAKDEAARAQEAVGFGDFFAD